ncbi:uncharacterized protein FA14DRAFT_162780 [Meira miltonrushii]|uniref:Uncharacterized protein n=1 Tax=Meira miltonrushii TaxID=1280837 RepID=A0A316V4C1_9BASI|nr:uncharacterized protein FA14DRAFT_162780 [Meira miltonrushii]PWN31371.1 hypothetical protein FA14DRAFT_162780 [Meira miltonrushii]
MSLALTEDDSVRDIFILGSRPRNSFSRLFEDFAASFLSRIPREEILSLSVPGKAEIKAHNSKEGTAWVTYLVLTTNRNDEVAGV